jgi:hypothetical protein
VTVSQRTPPSPSAAAATVRVVVRGLDATCWKCRQPTTCVVAVHDAAAHRSDDWVWFEDKHALALARELLLGAGQARFAGTIKPRARQDRRWRLPLACHGRATTSRPPATPSSCTALPQLKRSLCRRLWSVAKISVAAVLADLWHAARPGRSFQGLPGRRRRAALLGLTGGGRWSRAPGSTAVRGTS